MGHNSDPTKAQREQMLAEGQLGLFKLLNKKIEDGSITAAEMAIYRNLLRDNGWTNTPPPGMDNLQGSPTEDLPSYSKDEWDE